MTPTAFLLILNVFLLIAFGGVIGWLLHEVYNSTPKDNEDFDLNNVGNEEIF
jgi:hypothetical protein